MESILNVDDYGPGRYARTRILEQAGYTVREASTGREALALASEHNPPLILLDVNLPDMSGIEVCRLMRKDPRTFSATIVHISASNVAAHHQIAGLEGGADSYLIEPIEPAVLVATVKAFFRAREAEEALRRSNEELERFSYRVAHDLSEPLRTIVAHTQLMQLELGGHPAERVTSSLDYVVDAARRMHSFIDSLLTYSQATHIEQQTEKADCESMLALALNNLAVAIESSGARITHDPLPNISVGAGLEQVFQNLISNAVKYRRPDVSPEIHISVGEEDGHWKFAVSDNGIGIESKDIAAVFQIFHRLHGRDIPGSGIGLATCRKIVEANGGTLWVESEVGRGSTFFFTLPKTAAKDAN